jgi:glutaredoxin
MNNKQIIGFVIGIAVLTGIILLATGREVDPGVRLLPFAQCIKQSGTTFYGAFWCPHCAATKKMFGSAQKELPYVECSTPDTQHQTQICIDKKIEGYPTWVFPDGSRKTGELTLDELSTQTKCPLPSAS